MVGGGVVVGACDFFLNNKYAPIPKMAAPIPKSAFELIPPPSRTSTGGTGIGAGGSLCAA